MFLVLSAFNGHDDDLHRMGKKVPIIFRHSGIGDRGRLKGPRGMDLGGSGMMDVVFWWVGVIFGVKGPHRPTELGHHEGKNQKKRTGASHQTVRIFELGVNNQDGKRAGDYRRSWTRLLQRRRGRGPQRGARQKQSMSLFV